MLCDKCKKPFIPSVAGWLCDPCIMAEYDLIEDFEPFLAIELVECTVCSKESLESDLSTCTICGKLICDDCIEYQDESVVFCEDCHNESRQK